MRNFKAKYPKEWHQKFRKRENETFRQILRGIFENQRYFQGIWIIIFCVFLLMSSDPTLGFGLFHTQLGIGFGVTLVLLWGLGSLKLGVCLGSFPFDLDLDQHGVWTGQTPFLVGLIDLESILIFLFHLNSHLIPMAKELKNQTKSSSISFKLAKTRESFPIPFDFSSPLLIQVLQKTQE